MQGRILFHQFVHFQGKADATWVFMGWEGLDAKRRGVDLNAFSLEDSNIPYGYSPVLVAASDTLQ